MYRGQSEDLVSKGLLYVTSPQLVLNLMNNGNGDLDSKESWFNKLRRTFSYSDIPTS